MQGYRYSGCFIIFTWNSIIVKIIKRQLKVKKLYPKELICYLWFGGVDPEYQGQGVGTKWLKELISEDISKNRSLFLETSTLRNLPFYQKNGFEIYQELEVGCKIYFMRRKPLSTVHLHV